MTGIKDMNNIINPIYYKAIFEAIDKGFDAKKALWSISPDQIKCKNWLVNELKELPFTNPTVQLYGGWFGWPLIEILMQNININRLENIDKDPVALYTFRMFRKLHCYSKSKFIDTENDVSNKCELDNEADLVINTSGEHMPDLPELIKDKKYKTSCVFAIQSNNMHHLDEHTNCCKSEDELVEKSKLSNVLFKGTHPMSNGCERYMVIGIV